MNDSTINGGVGNDSIFNSGNSVLIEGEADNDTIWNKSGKNVTISSGDGNDIIENNYYGATVSIDAGAGDDSIWNDDPNVTIDAGNGNDTIWNHSHASGISISSGEDDDYINNSLGANVTISGGTGNDYITDNGGSNVTISGDSGNDTINLSSNTKNALVRYGINDGNDIIEGFNESSTLQIMADRIDSASFDGENLFLTIGQDTITLTNAAYITPLNIIDKNGNKLDITNVTENNDFILNNKPNVTIGGEAGNDFILNNGNRVTISMGTGWDTVWNTASDVVFCHSGGNDLIKGFNDSSTFQILANNINAATTDGTNIFFTVGQDTITLTGGESLETLKIVNQYGNKIDLISTTDEDNLVINNSPNVTIDSGAGNDLIFNSAPNIVIRHSSGSKRIKGFNDSSTLQISADSIDAATTDGTNIFFTVGQDTITLTNGFDLEGYNVVDQNGNKIEVELEGIGNDNKYVNLYGKGKTVITGGGNDHISSTSNSNDKNFISTGKGNDYVNNNGTNTTIKCGANDDTVYTCSNSSYNKIYGNAGKDSLHCNGAYSTAHGGNDFDEMYNNGRGSQFYGDEDGDILSNGEHYYLGDEIRQQREKDAEDAKNVYDKADEELRRQWEEDPVTQDILRNGANSEYLQDLSEEEREVAAKFYEDVYNAIKTQKNWLDAIKQAKIDAEISGYQKDLDWLDKRIDIRANRGKNFIKFDGENYLYPKQEKYLREISKLNKQYGRTLEKMDALDKAGKKLGLLGTVSEGLEFIDAAYSAYKNPTSDNIDKVVLEEIDVFVEGLSYIPVLSWMKIPGVTQLASSALKTGYMMARHSDVDVGSTFMNNLVGFTSDSYIPNRNKLNAFYLNRNLSNAVASYSTLEEFYIDKDTVVMNGGTGNDAMLNNFNNNVFMDGDEDDDFIKNYNSSKVTVLGGLGNDLIVNLNSPTVTVDGGDGNDSIISNYSAKVSINTSEGNNYVSVYDSSDVTISSGNGNNSVENFGKHVTINTGSGNDSILNIGAHVSINAGDGDNEIDSCGDEVTIQTGEGDNYIHAEGNNVSLTTGDGNNYVETRDNINVNIQTGSGDDYVENYSESGKINVDDGENYILSVGDSNTLEAGVGDDFIELVGNENSIVSGECDDLIFVYEGSNNTVEGASGNDTIFGYSDSSNVVEMSNITTTQAKGEDMLVTTDDGTLTFADIVGTSITFKLADGSTRIIEAVDEEPAWKLDCMTATYGTSGETLITLSGITSLDGISLNDKVVTVSKAALNQGAVTISNGYTLALGNDVDKTTTTTAGWTLSGTTATYKAAATSAGYKVSNNEIVYSEASGGETFTVSGVKTTAQWQSCDLQREHWWLYFRP